MRNTPHSWRWWVLAGAVLAGILLPFAFWGRQIESATNAFLSGAQQQPVRSALVLGGLLASDIFLPVPSSIVSTACGLVLGAAAGTFVSLAGMMVSCLAGFALARGLGRPLVRRWVGEDELARATRLCQRFGVWAIIVARPVPVLAEASVFVVGLGATAFPRFLLLCLLSNLGVSAVYAAAGAWSSSVNAFLPAVAASVALPWLGMALFGPGRAGVAPAATQPGGVGGA